MCLFFDLVCAICYLNEFVFRPPFNLLSVRYIILICFSTSFIYYNLSRGCYRVFITLGVLISMCRINKHVLFQRFTAHKQSL
ncbi:unknown [Cryptophlebia leucotreta granulovirus]|uniref:Uncharacterized protein n=1 Tax=Cryptophlebia leucotreta granulosis virus TaxID=35254 RepID=Q7T5R9_GVCL|nr:hypothetical protein [Cryptophlebia leucotreta granulovirus]AAQ21615.1 unknown [Cryptophlebia leucotreta granulovirus]